MSNYRKYRKIIPFHHMGFIPNMQRWFNFRKLIDVIYHIDRLKEKILDDHISRFRKSI